MPARTRRRWLTTSASAGSSRSVGARRRERRVTIGIYSPAAPPCASRHWSMRPPWLHAAPDAMAIATKVTSAISASVAPALRAFPTCASMHHGHWVMCAMPRAISSFVFDGNAPSRKAFASNSRNARYGSGASSRMRLNCRRTSTPWNVIGASSRGGGSSRPLYHHPSAVAARLAASIIRRVIAIAVHGGAGRDTTDDRASRRTGLARAIRVGWEILAGGGGALDAVVEAVAVLEDDPHFNAGLGSVLNLDGDVEMDASVMTG